MALPTSPDDICNLALDLCGEAPTSNIENPVSDTDFILQRNYDTVRQECLRKAPWHFAKLGALILNNGSTGVSPPTGNPPAPSNATTTYDYTDSYKLPADYIRLLSVNGDDEWCQSFHYDIRPDSKGAGLCLLFNNSGAPSINIRYIQDVTNVPFWDALFRRFMITSLAHEISYQVTKNKDVSLRIQNLLKPIQAEAQAINGQERRPVRIERSKTLRDRRWAGTDNLGGWEGWGTVGPVPSNPPSGTVTSAGISSNVSFLVFTGSPITTSGVVQMNAQGASGSIPFFNAINNVGLIAPGAIGTILIMGSSGPVWTTGTPGTGTVTTVGLSMPGATNIFTLSGTPVTGGGTLTATVNAASGSVIYASAANTLSALAPGTASQVFQMNGAGTFPIWGADPVLSTVQNANTRLSGPASGSAAAPTFRADVLADYQLMTFCQGRLYLVASSPYTDSVAASTLRFGPLPTGNLITIANSGNTALITQTFTEATLALSGLTATTLYDVYATSASSTTVSLSTSAWTGNTPPARGTDLAGRPTKTGATQSLWVGVIQADSASTTTSSNASRHIWNAFNRAPCTFNAVDNTASWTTASTSPVTANGNTTDGAGRVSLISGLGIDQLFLSNGAYSTSNNAAGINVIGIGVNSTTVQAVAAQANVAGVTSYGNEVTCTYVGVPAIGASFYQRLNYAAVGTATFYGTLVEMQFTGMWNC